MKKSNLFFLLLCLALVACSGIYIKKMQKRSRKDTYIKYINKNEFKQKIKQFPAWQSEQIADDFLKIKNYKISQVALNQTYAAIMKNIPYYKNEFARFRVIDNKIYRYIPDNVFYQKEVTYVRSFENALRTLSLLTRLPNIDVIISSQDGTPIIELNNDDFYITEKRSEQAPILGWAKKKSVDLVVLIPDSFQLAKPLITQGLLNESQKSSWEEKTSKLFWRGFPTKGNRIKLCYLSIDNPSLIDAGFGKKSTMNSFFLQLKNSKEYANEFLECYKGFATFLEQCEYKYLPVINGCMCTYPGYQWRLLSNSCVFKQQSEEIQWFYKYLKPYVHFIPIEEEFTDVVEQVKWAKNNDEQCKKIAQNATDFVMNNLTFETIYVYLLKVLQTYEKQQVFDKQFLKEATRKDNHWICLQNRKKALKIAKKRNFKIIHSVFSNHKVLD